MEPARVDKEAADREFVVWLERELKKRACRLLSHARAGATLRPTSLVNEAWIAISSHEAYRSRDRLQFLRMMPSVLRSIIVDYARARRSQKRGGGLARVPLSDVEPSQEFEPTHILDLNDAVAALALEHPRAGRVFEGKFFGGQTRAEIATILGISQSAVDGDISLGRAWLNRYLGARGYEKER